MRPLLRLKHFDPEFICGRHTGLHGHKKALHKSPGLLGYGNERVLFALAITYGLSGAHMGLIATLR